MVYVSLRMLQVPLIVYGLGAIISFSVAGMIKLISHLLSNS